MPDTGIAAAPEYAPPPMHPMELRRGESLSPMFGALLCWLLGLQLAYLLDVERILDSDEYARLVAQCTARAAARKTAPAMEAPA